MAVIGKIRQRTGLLLVFIGLAMVLFLLMDALSSRSMIGGGGGDDTVGKINGRKVQLQEFNNAFTSYQDQVRLINPQMQMDDQTNAAIVRETWNDFVFKNTAGQYFEDLGIVVTPEELAEQFKGRFTHPLVRQLFGNPQTGQFDPQTVQNYVKNLDQDQTGEARKQYAAIEKIVEQDRLKNKYSALISKAFYMPKYIVKYYLKQNGERAMISFVSVPLSQIPDKDVLVGNADMEDYIKRNEHKYKRKASRSIEYVVFPLIPSVEDSARAKSKIEELLADLQASQPNDSAFLKRNALRGMDATYFSEEELAGRGKIQEILSSPAGTVIGPYIEDGSYVFTKVQGSKTVADSVRAAHILLDNSNPTAAQAKADSLIAKIKSGQLTFGQAAFENTLDEGTKQQGGDLGFFPKGQMVKPFNDMVFYQMNVGEIKTVASQFGLHIIVLVDQKGRKPAVQFADIAVPVQAGSDTEKELFRKAKEFEQTYNTPEKFAEARKKGFTVLKSEGLQPDQVEIAEIGPARKLIQWSFQQNKPGVISYFDESDKFIVAHLTKVSKEGLPTVEEVKTEVEAAVRREKKAKMLKERIDKVLTPNMPLEQLATKVNGTFKDSAKVAFNIDAVEDAGNEPNLVGAAFGLKPGQTSKAIIGSQAVYVVRTNSRETPEETAFPEEFFAMQFRQSVLSRLTYENIIEAWKEKSKVEDNRYMFY